MKRTPGWFWFFLGVCTGGIVDCFAHMVSR